MSKKICVLLTVVLLVTLVSGCSGMGENFSLEDAIQGSWEYIGLRINIANGEYELEYTLNEERSSLFSECNGTYTIIDDEIHMREYDGQMYDIMEFAIINGKHYLIGHDGTKYEKIG